jgi:hypothetical protein
MAAFMEINEAATVFTLGAPGEIRSRQDAESTAPNTPSCRSG